MQNLPLSVAANLIADEDAIIAKALQILSARIHHCEYTASSPEQVRNYLIMSYSKKEREFFSVLFLNAMNGVIAVDVMFSGTLTSCSVYPREVVKAALLHNAASVILCHNHPSGSTKPSESDLLLTRALTQALALIDVRVNDHFIVSGVSTYSFAEHGQL